jgi:hypothetical protein
MRRFSRFGTIALAASLAGIAGAFHLGSGAAGQATPRESRRAGMKREIIRVEPLSSYLEKWKAPTSAVTRHGDTI